jgi:hypothetical protein
MVAEVYDMKQEEQATLLSPAEDESSRAVFGLIKKLNTAPDTKKGKTPCKICFIFYSICRVSVYVSRLLNPFCYAYHLIVIAIFIFCSPF